MDEISERESLGNRPRPDFSIWHPDADEKKDIEGVIAMLPEWINEIKYVTGNM